MRAFFQFLVPLLLFSVLPHTTLLYAQAPTATLTGTIVDVDGEPLPGAHVFIAVSMIGTTTDSNGTYSLVGVPLGAHRLYVSMLGFEPSFRDVMLREAKTHTFDFSLEETVIEAGEITVEGKADRRWKRRLEKFTRLFIGETPNAEHVTIKNPEVLDFTDKVGHFEAIAAAPLVIENHALGYRITYFLKDFVAEPMFTRYDGEPLYEELEPANAEQAAEWDANRRKAFIGSFRHFALALLAGQTEAQGFMTYMRPAGQDAVGSAGPTIGSQRYPLEPGTLLKPGETPNEKTLDFKGFVEIVFKGELEDPAYIAWQQAGRRKPKFQSSFINLGDGPTTLDYKGDILDPYGVTFRGYLAFERVADELPKEYRPR